MNTIIFYLFLVLSSLCIAAESGDKYMCVGLDNHKDITNPLYFTPLSIPTEIGTANGRTVKFSIQSGEVVLTLALDKQQDKYVFIGATAGGVIRYATANTNIHCLPAIDQ